LYNYIDNTTLIKASGTLITYTENIKPRLSPAEVSGKTTITFGGTSTLNRIAEDQKEQVVLITSSGRLFYHFYLV